MNYKLETLEAIISVGINHLGGYSPSTFPAITRCSETPVLHASLASDPC